MAKNIPEPIFPGDSEELKNFLKKKRDALKDLQKEVNDEERENRICGLIYVCEAVLRLPYFGNWKILSMPKLIEKVKEERESIKTFMFDLKPDVEDAKTKADEAFKAAGSYLANKFEDSYDSKEQINARECIDEYQAIKFEYDEAEEDLKANWWLLGIIHRPVGFFKKAE